jgi:putative ABC transport system permease protein
MRNNRLARWLGALMPPAARRELFEPAIHDLHADAARRGGPTSLPTLVLFFQCWRLAPAEVLSMILHDVRHALRLLIREPGFTAAAVLTLSLGVGANVAVFCVVNAALLRPLPYPDADRLVVLQHRDRRTGISKDFIAIGDFVDLKARQHAFESLAAYGSARGTIFDEGDPFDVALLQATPELFEALRAQPVLGRTLTVDDTRDGSAPVVILGYDTWQQRFGGNPAIVGRSIKIGTVARQVTRQVVGVAAPEFRFPANAKTDAIIPMKVPLSAPAQRKSGWVFAAARLKPSTPLAQADADVGAVSVEMERQYPDANQGSEYFVKPLREHMLGDTRAALLFLLAAVAVVLLIACVNVANLLVARAVGRRQEMAVRVALGAARWRLVTQSLAESAVLATLAGVTGVAFASWLTPYLASLVPTSVNLPALGTLAVDQRVLAFAAAICALTTLIFGLVAGFGVRLDNASAALVNPGRVTAAGSARAAASVLVILEMALAIVLLTGAGLVLRSFARLLSVDPGFVSERVLTLDVGLPADRYRDAEARRAFYDRAFEGLRSIAGVEAAGAATVVPLTGNNWTVPLDRADRPVPAGQRPPDVGWQAATGGYFSALRIPLRAGRFFNDADRPGGRQVVIISEAIRDRFFPGEDPLGKMLQGDGETAEIVGVVGNISRAALSDKPAADLYFPMEQAPQNATTMFIRTTADPRAAVPRVRERLRSLEPSIVLRDIRTMDDIVRSSVELTRLAASLLGLFAVCALLLASVGIYGVMSYAVKQRTRELGTRLALGATPTGILWMVMRDGLRVAAIGAAIGLIVSVGTARSMAAMLFGTSPADPVTLAAATSILLAVALAASYVPARRATRLDPRESLIADR